MIALVRPLLSAESNAIPRRTASRVHRRPPVTGPRTSRHVSGIQARCTALALSFLAGLSTVSLGGCASTDGIRSAARISVRAPSGLEIEPEGKGRDLQVHLPFEGDNPDECGMQKDSFFLDVGVVRCANDPAAELATLFIAELRKAGFQVATGSGVVKPTTVQIDGELLRLYAEPVAKSSMEADIQVILKARTGNGLDAERKFYEKGRGGDFQRAVNSAVRKMLQSMVTSVIELMDQYPGLGKPAKLPPRVKPEPESGP